jgi:hypothetical protein
MAMAAVASLLMMAAAVVTGFGFPDPAQPGDCLEPKQRGGKTGGMSEFRIVSCTAPKAAYKVAIVGGRVGCDDNTYGYTYNSGRSRGRAMCLILNAKAGDCFYQEIGFPTGKAAKVACGPSATYRVVAVVPGRADHTACGPDIDPLNHDPTRPLALAYPQPPLTICTVGV